MRLSEIYAPTIKDVVPESEALNYRLMYKAGFVRKSSAGYFSFLPLGNRVLKNINTMFDRKLGSLAYFEINMPPDISNEDFYKSISGGKLSYKELPIGTWQAKSKLAEGIRPRMGLLQAKTWESIEGFKLTTTSEVLNQEQNHLIQVFNEIFSELNIDFDLIDKLSWGFHGELDKVIMLPNENGEDSMVYCSSCKKSMLIDSMPCLPAAANEDTTKELSLAYTPQVKTIAAVAAYLGKEASEIVKTLLYKADDKIVAVLLRGDRDLSEVKLGKVLKCKNLRAATENEVYEATKAEVGFVGPIGLSIEIICDYEAAALRNAVVGANITDHHYINAVMDRDYTINKIADIKNFTSGEACPECGGETVIIRGFVLGTVNKNESPLIFINNQGSSESAYSLEFELNLSRILAAVIERNNDKEGLLLTKGIAPFDIVVMAVHSDNQEQAAAAVQIYSTLKALNFNVLLDDRAERLSVKFKDSELMGIPLRVTVGRKISEGMVELKFRGKEMQEIIAADILEYLLINEV